MGTVKLLDCTLGIGGKLNKWRYGEGTTRQMRTLLAKSGADIVELGLLRKQECGIECSVFDTTLLPPGFRRQKGQLYSALLDENYPLLSSLPDQGGKTVDIIRVEISQKKSSEVLQYSKALKEKGYRVSILITETAQYGRDELARLLRDVDELYPWSCGIYDGSGIMSAEELKDTFALFDEMLRGEISIGFHGCDNQKKAMDLAKLFLSMETKRTKLLDASVAGMGSGALHLSTKTAAKWLNKTNDRDYNLFIIAYLEDFVRPMLEPKMGAGAQMLYYGTAKNRCSYLYTEYYSALSVEASEQFSVFAEIASEDAFCFSPSAANMALLRYRKKQLNMVIVIPTANRSAEIDTMLSSSMWDLLKYGVDLIIWDSSIDEKTHAVVKNYQLKGYENLYYQKSIDTVSTNDTVKSILRTYCHYEYIWILRDGWIPTISSFYQDLLCVAQKGAECITVDSSFRNSGQYMVKFYDDCLDYFKENGIRIAILGSLILKHTMVDNMLAQCIPEDETKEFWLPSAVLRGLSSQSVQAALIISGVFYYSGDSSRIPEMSLGDNVLDKWIDSWQGVIENLPEEYEPGMANAMRVQMFDLHPFHMKSMLRLRGCGQFSIPIYQRYSQTLTKVSDTPKWKFSFAAMMPRWMARAILSADNRAKTQPQSRLFRMLDKIRNIFIRLGA